MMLFPAGSLKSKVLPSKRDHAGRFRIPTGAPRLVESSSARREQASAIAWETLIEAIHRSSDARLELLKGRAGSDRTPCPWERITGCTVDCRCRGARTVTVDFLRAHYTHLATEIALTARPAPQRRPS